jgi:hypothetical protein
LPGRYEPPRPVLSEAEVYRLLARAGVVWGTTRIEDGAQRKMLMAEWHEALKFWPYERVNAALGELARSSRWWPTIADLVAACRALEPSRPPSVPPVEAPPTPEELKARGVALARIKAQYGWAEKFRPESEPEVVREPVVYDVPVSDVSSTLKQLREKRR